MCDTRGQLAGAGPAGRMVGRIDIFAFSRFAFWVEAGELVIPTRHTELGDVWTVMCCRTAPRSLRRRHLHLGDTFGSQKALQHQASEAWNTWNFRHRTHGHLFFFLSLLFILSWILEQAFQRASTIPPTETQHDTPSGMELHLYNGQVHT